MANQESENQERFDLAWMMDKGRLEELIPHFIRREQHIAKCLVQRLKVKLEQMEEPVDGANKSFYAILGHYEEPEPETLMTKAYPRGNKSDVDEMYRVKMLDEGEADMCIYDMKVFRDCPTRSHPTVYGKTVHNLFISNVWHAICECIKDFYSKNGFMASFHRRVQSTGYIELKGHKCLYFTLAYEYEGEEMKFNVFPVFITTNEEKAALAVTENGRYKLAVL